MKRLALLLVALLSLSAVAADEEQEQRLQEIKQRIETLQRELHQVKSERDQLLKDLEKSERDIGELLQRIDRIKGDMQERGEKLQELQQEQKQLEDSRRSMQRRVEQEVAAAYRLGRQEQIKLLLNQQDPQHIARQLRYHEYFLKERHQVIGDYLTTLDSLRSVSAGITRERDNLAAERDRLQAREQQLSSARRARQLTLDKLAAELASKSGELQTLQADQSRLQRLVDEVGRAIANLISPRDQTPFARQRGQLPWPAQGRRGNAFGGSRGSGLKWSGVTIHAAEGAPVRAIARGRVVFSDYLRGQGLLLILDHGEGYMSLYGHNQSLTHAIGEWVEAGDTIARVGNSGGLATSGLYFEIRHRGQPQDPARWCRS